MDYLTIIPARAGSKGIPNKNIRLINGKPLLAWSIESSLHCNKIKHTIVSTDSNKIAQISRDYGAEVPELRPSGLAQDETPTEPVLIHVLERLEIQENYRPDAVILLQPTSPFRKPDSLKKAIGLFEKQQADSLLSVCPNHHFFWKNSDDPDPLYPFQSRPRRQDIRPQDQWFRENGSIYITKTEILKKYKNRLGGKIVLFVMSEEESYEIDSEIDFKINELILKEKYHENQ
ncbi:acylneuraminate cytidylyltransferase family protein [Sporolactobacillus sp. THM7-4]|nr:acylneuraminate cytidylyltransferase family protein [Sporolactobacillus sp. THM7-4]